MILLMDNRFFFKFVDGHWRLGNWIGCADRLGKLRMFSAREIYLVLIVLREIPDQLHQDMITFAVIDV